MLNVKMASVVSRFEKNKNKDFSKLRKPFKMSSSQLENKTFIVSFIIVIKDIIYLERNVKKLVSRRGGTHL
jgi:hypothetical protein